MGQVGNFADFGWSGMALIMDGGNDWAVFHMISHPVGLPRLAFVVKMSSQ